MTTVILKPQCALCRWYVQLKQKTRNNDGSRINWVLIKSEIILSYDYRWNLQNQKYRETVIGKHLKQHYLWQEAKILRYYTK